MATLLKDLRLSLDVEVYSLYSGGPLQGQLPVVAPPRVPECAATLRGNLPSDCHVLAMGWAAPEVFLALDGIDTIRSLVCAGLHPGEATLRALDMEAVAKALETQFARGLSTSRPYFRLFFQDLPESDLAKLVESVDERVDWAAYRIYYQSYGEVDLTKVRIEVPTLYLHSKLDLSGMRDLLVGIAPQAEVGASLTSFPTHLQHAAEGQEVSRAALDFLGRVA